MQLKTYTTVTEYHVVNYTDLLKQALVVLHCNNYEQVEAYYLEATPWHAVDSAPEMEHVMKQQVAELLRDVNEHSAQWTTHYECKEWQQNFLVAALMKHPVRNFAIATR